MVKREIIFYEETAPAVPVHEFPLMRGKAAVTAPKGPYENILLSVSDAAHRIDTGITLPGYEKNELGELRKKIEESGVEVPILVRANSGDGYEVIDGWHRLQICRELGRETPATLLNIDDVRAREIALEENLSRRILSQRQKKEIAFQLRDKWNFSNRKIASRLCVSHATVCRWLEPAKPALEKTQEQKIIDFHRKKGSVIAKIGESIMLFMSELQSGAAIREEVGRGLSYLQDELSALSSLLNMLSEALKAVTAQNELVA
jgi:ParB/RepB/Spo0J family partition protein